MTTPKIILLVYIALMELGGLMGFIKAKSKASLIASSIFSAVLLLFVFDVFPFQYHIYVVGFLMVFFAKRFMGSKKFMPNGLMMILSAIALILGLIVK